MKKILFLSYIFLLSMIMLVGCGSKGIVISGQQVVGVGSSITLEAKVSSNEPIVWRSSNKDIATVSKGVVSGISVGEVTIYVTCGKEQASIKIRVVGEQEDKDVTDPYQVQALETISRMSLEQKVGELFVVGVNDASNEVKRLISRFNIGNVILMPHTSSTYEELIETVRELQEQITNNNVVPGFVFNYKDASPYKLLSSLAIIPSNPMIALSGDEENAYKSAYVLGSELRNFGITATLNPNVVIDEYVQNYSDDPEVLDKYVSKELDGYAYAGVMGTAMVFPGTGEYQRDDSTPKNLKGVDALKREDLLPLLKLFESGIDAIMASNAIFFQIDEKYPATLSYPVLSTFLREELEYDGLVLSYFLDDYYIVKDYRSKEDNVAVLAINAGVDMLVYSYDDYIEEDYKAIISAVKNGIIEESRIDEALLRIILKKNKYDLLSDNHYMPVWNASEYDATNDILVGKEIINGCVALISGEMFELDKTKPIIVASSRPNAILIDDYDEDEKNSFAYLVYLKLIEEGFSHVDWVVFDEYDRDEARQVRRQVNEYEQAIYAVSYVDSRRWLGLEENVIFVSLAPPLNIRSEEVSCHIAIYGYERENVDAFIDCFFGESQIKDLRPKGN